MLKPAQRSATSFVPPAASAPQRLGVEAVVDEPAHRRAAGGQRRGGGAQRDLEVARLEHWPVRAAGGAFAASRNARS